MAWALPARSACAAGNTICPATAVRLRLPGGQPPALGRGWGSSHGAGSGLRRPSRRPPGLVLPGRRDWCRGRSSGTRSCLVHNDAFADHWGPHQGARGLAGIAGARSRPDLSVVAIERAHGEVVAMCLNYADPENGTTGRPAGGLDRGPGHREAVAGAGVASALIAASLARSAAEGFTPRHAQSTATIPRRGPPLQARLRSSNGDLHHPQIEVGSSDQRVSDAVEASGVAAPRMRSFTSVVSAR